MRHRIPVNGTIFTHIQCNVADGTIVLEQRSGGATVVSMHTTLTEVKEQYGRRPAYCVLQALMKEGYSLD